jgi:hypothetical protein
MSVGMASKCCSKCARTLPLSSFLVDPSDVKSLIRVNCDKCRGYGKKSWYKRMALQPLDPNVSSKRPATAYTRPVDAPPTPPPHVRSKIRLEPSIYPLLPPGSRLEALQNFHTALDGVKMEYYIRYRERWFSIGLRNGICDACFLRDKGSQSPFLMSTDNEMDPGEMASQLSKES